MANDGKNDEKTRVAFTVDRTDTQETASQDLPSVTRLLNRPTLAKVKAQQSPAPVEPPSEEECLTELLDRKALTLSQAFFGKKKADPKNKKAAPAAKSPINPPSPRSAPPPPAPSSMKKAAPTPPPAKKPPAPPSKKSLPPQSPPLAKEEPSASTFSIEKTNTNIRLDSLTKLLKRGTDSTLSGTMLNPPDEPVEEPKIIAFHSEPKPRTLQNREVQDITEAQELVSQGAKDILYFEGKNPMLFQARIAHAGTTRSEVWNGMRLNPQWIPETWKQLASDGTVFIGPEAPEESEGQILRLALGVRSHEYLAITRLSADGSATKTTGLVMGVASQAFEARSDEAATA